VLRRRVADALAALSGILTVGPEDDLSARQLRFEESVSQLELIAKPLAAQRVLAGAHIPAVGNRRRADAVDAVRSLVPSVRDLVAVTRAEPGLTAEPNLVRLRSAVTANAGAIRQAIGRRPGTPYRHLPPPRRRAPGEQQAAAGAALARAAAAMRAIDGALAGLDEIYPSPPPSA
jgi:hypothetical protein